MDVLVRLPTPPTALGLSIALILLSTIPARPLAWTGTLEGGGEVQVDPSTHRATRVENGASRQLWDGVHRLEDGSVVIVHDGTAVPTQDMLQTWEGSAPPAEALAGHFCERLVRRVCGRDNACRATAACLNARSLLNSEREAQRRAPYEPGAATATEATARCESALADPKFAPCVSDLAATGPSPCQELVDRVCGADGRCEKSPACPPARHLLGQEANERADGLGNPEADTASGAMCREAMGNEFFSPCR